MSQLIVTFARFLLNRFDNDTSSKTIKSFRQPRLSRIDVLDRINTRGITKLDFSYSNLAGADLSGLDLRESDFTECTLRGANLSESDLRYAVLSRADCRQANLAKANLALTDLTNAYLREANLNDATLFRAILDGANLYDATLQNTNLHRASFQGTRIHYESLGKGIAQDSDSTYERLLLWTFRTSADEDRKLRTERLVKNRLIHAEQVYRSLKIAFANDGQYAASSWAYVRERQFHRRMHAPLNARHHFRHEYPENGRLKWLRRIIFYVRHFYFWLLYWLAEVSSGHGESPHRVIWLALLTLLLFPLLYAVEGGVVTNTGSMIWIDYFIYSFGAFTTIGFERFEAVTYLAQLITSFEALVGISILALLMFVLGNSISRK